MDTKEEKIKMRKRNMKVYPIHKGLAWDYLFYYTIDFLFFTQIKGISASSVILKDSFFAIFNTIMQIPANIIIEFLGRRNSIILGNILGCLYLVVAMLSNNLGDLIFAEFISSIAFSIKNIAQPSLLNESIPPSRNKGSLFAKIGAKGSSRYYLFNGITKIIAGYLFTINGYLPFLCSLITLVIATAISFAFIEPVSVSNNRRNRGLVKKQLKEIKDGFKYVLNSERLKALILSSSLIVGLLSILNNYHVSLLKDLNVSSVWIGIVAALGCYVSSYASRRQAAFHNKFRNKTLEVVAFILAISTWLAGICGVISKIYSVWIIAVILMNITFNFCHGIYYTVIDKYLRNFANKKIDTKIFATSNLFVNIVRALVGFYAAFLIDKTTTANCMMFMGALFTFLYILMTMYMKPRVGLKPDEYSEEETKYDELKGE